MREPSEYMSADFVKVYFPAFSQTLNASRTVDEYFSALCLYCDFMKKDFLEQTRLDARCYADYLKTRIDKGSFSTSTMIIRLSSYRKMERFLNKAFPGVLKETAWEQIQRPHLDSSISEKRIPSLERLDELLEASKKLDKMWYVIIALVIRCALTAGEVVSLRTKDFQVEGGHMYLHLNKKNNDRNFTKERQLRLTPDIRELVECYIGNMTKCDAQGHLFYNRRGNALTQKNIREAFIKLQADHELKYPISSIRSRAILQLLENTQDSEAVAEFVDLSSMRISSFVKAAGLINDRQAVNEYVNISINSCYPDDNADEGEEEDE